MLKDVVYSNDVVHSSLYSSREAKKFILPFSRHSFFPTQIGRSVTLSTSPNSHSPKLYLTIVLNAHHAFHGFVFRSFVSNIFYPDFFLYSLFSSAFLTHSQKLNFLVNSIRLSHAFAYSSRYKRRIESRDRRKGKQKMNLIFFLFIIIRLYMKQFLKNTIIMCVLSSELVSWIVSKWDQLNSV